MRERGRDWQWDHWLALGLGGDNSDGQWRPGCTPCHRVKTNDDVGRMVKADAQGGKTGQYKRRKARQKAGKRPLLKSQGFKAWRTFSGAIRHKKKPPENET